MMSKFDAKPKGINKYEAYTREQITEAFRVFDDRGTGKTAIKNIGVISRALGRVPRQAELKSFIKQVEDPESRGSVSFEVLLPALTDILIKDKWKPAPKEKLLEAFKFLDTKGKGHINPNFMRSLLTEHGDKLDEEEIEKFLSMAINPAKETVDYVKCYEKLAVPEIVDILENKGKILAEVKDEVLISETAE